MTEDEQLDLAFFEAMGEPPMLSTCEDLLGHARKRAKASDVKLPFRSAEAVFDRLDATQGNARAVLQTALGLGGEISWVSMATPWHDPARMENRLAMEGFHIRTLPGSYSGTVVQGSHVKRGISARADLMEDNVARYLREGDPAAPALIQASFFGFRPEDQRYIDGMVEDVNEWMYFRGHYDLAPKGRNLHMTVPFSNGVGTVARDFPYDFYETLFNHLEMTEVGERGGRRFSVTTSIVSPRLEKVRGLERGPVVEHRCTLLPPLKKLPTSEQVARFFDLTSGQVEAVVRSFYCPPPALVVPPRGIASWRSPAVSAAK